MRAIWPSENRRDMSLRDLVRLHLGDPLAEIAEQHAVTVPHGALSTAALRRVHGTTTSGATWAFVVKSVQSIKYSPQVLMVPEDKREELIALFPWRTDADVYLCPPPLPTGLRLPRMYLLEDLGDDRLVLWLEDVPIEAAGWDLARYSRAARLLGELAALRPASGVNAGLHDFCHLALPRTFLPLLLDPATWRHPLIAEHADPLLQSDLLAVLDRIDSLLAALDRLPHSWPHGDASPQNLLVPADGSAEFVAIDWSWPHPAALGFDLGQLLVGLAHEGDVEPDDLPAIHDTILAAYTSAVGVDVSFGYIASLVLRCAWTALPLDRLGEEPSPELHELARKRAGLARFIVDLGRSLPDR